MIGASATSSAIPEIELYRQAKRMACHIEEGYEQRGVPESEAERRAWATVNKETHGGKKSGSGRGKAEDHSPARKGGRLGGQGRWQQTPGCTFARGPHRARD